ncbi:melanoma-associated antigen 10-like [Choloepus didactylus]|uniref:melanoma-associated antigen 10-like n=1 Tax=Choloepus didactylus TaxID=27675 RepID=UPI00189ECF0B|nr:melanoma-associated antigen 10-like [Choloepus didactylus]
MWCFLTSALGYGGSAVSSEEADSRQQREGSQALLDFEGDEALSEVVDTDQQRKESQALTGMKSEGVEAAFEGAASSQQREGSQALTGIKDSGDLTESSPAPPVYIGRPRTVLAVHSLKSPHQFLFQGFKESGAESPGLRQVSSDQQSGGGPGTARTQGLWVSITHPPAHTLVCFPQTRVTMSLSPKCSRYMPDQDLQEEIETQHLLNVPISMTMELGDSSASPSPLVSDSPEEVLAAGAPHSPKSPQRVTSTSTSSSISDESSSSKEEESPSTLLDKESLLREALDKKVADLVQFLLLKYQKKELVTKEDILKTITRNYEGYFPVILKRTRECIELVFGFDVKEADASGDVYVFSHTLDLTYNEMLSDDRGMPKAGLLILMLSLIFMEGNCTSEEEIWSVLNATGVYADREHLIYGEPRKLITKDLVQEKYLEYQQIPGSDPVHSEFLWGPRAHAETSKMKVLEFFTRVIDTAPNAFPAWYDDAVRDEEERTQARIASSNDIASESSSPPSQ